MIVEVIGGADEHPQARVVDIDDLGRLHLALGEVTDEEADEVLRALRAGPAPGRRHRRPRRRGAARRGRAARDGAGLGRPLGRHGRERREQGLGRPTTARASRCTWRARPVPDPALDPVVRHGMQACAGCCGLGHCGDAPLTRQDVAVRMTSRHGFPIMTGTPGRPLSTELSEQLLSVAVDILAEEGWGRLNSDRIAARARAGKAGHLPALADHGRARPLRGEPVRPRHRRRRTAARCARTCAALVAALDPAAGPRGAGGGQPRRCGPARGGPARRSGRRPRCARSPPRSREIGRRAAERGEPIDAEPARAARLGARGVLVAALHRRR